MDIAYLLFLQDIRNGLSESVTDFMVHVSDFAVSYLYVMAVLVYWCLDKRCGLHALGSWCCVVAINSVVKLTACVYRPWIRDARVVPAGDSIKTATGYSFPSGHSVTASSTYGSFAVDAWKKIRWISFVCIFMVLLTGFSRNFLGVHTPQDVIVGVTEGTLTAIGLYFVFGYLEKHPEKENWFLIGGVVYCVAALCYITFKPYPMDYVDGALLVDPDKMMNDGYGDLAKLLTLCVCRFIDKTWIRFRPELTKKSLAAGIVGVAILMLMEDSLKAPLVELLGGHWGKFMKSVIVLTFALVIWPLVLKAVQKKEQQTAAA
ncbi:MAG: phosphatase PAP2 family protein [Oscillospiraceae bacterium]|nr:phosphatase PAP2 family protein [Oscillospiraceae bacterium]